MSSDADGDRGADPAADSSAGSGANTGTDAGGASGANTGGGVVLVRMLVVLVMPTPGGGAWCC